MTPLNSREQAPHRPHDRAHTAGADAWTIERLRAYLEASGMTEDALAADLLESSLAKAMQVSGKLGPEGRLRQGIEELQRLLDRALGHAFHIDPHKGQTALEGVRAALGFGGLPVDWPTVLQGDVLPEEVREACRHRLPQATPKEVRLAMPHRAFKFWLFASE